MSNFRPARISDLLAAQPQFTDFFRAGAAGWSVWRILNTADACLKMVAVTDALGLPGVAAVQAEVGPILDAVADIAVRNRLKRLCGSIAKTVLASNGRYPTGVKGSVPVAVIGGRSERVFKTGEVYSSRPSDAGTKQR